MPLHIARRAFLLAIITAGITQPAAAQTYPSQNINVVVSFAAGGIADVIARLVASVFGRERNTESASVPMS